MRILLAVLSTMVFMIGGAILATAEAEFQEIEALILFLIAAVLLAGAAIVDAVYNLQGRELAAFTKLTRGLVAVLLVVLLIGGTGLGLDEWRDRQEAGIRQSEDAISETLTNLALSQEYYRTLHDTYATSFDQLVDAGVMQESSIEESSGYRFLMNTHPSGNSFAIGANPLDRESTSKYFYIDQTLLVRYSTSSPATFNSPIR